MSVTNSTIYNRYVFDYEALNRLFWPYIEKDKKTGCWNWTGRRNEAGYGVFTGQFKAHRLSYTMRNGPIPPGMLIRHMCHNKRCCNPDHLQLGDESDNAMDNVRDGVQRLTAFGRPPSEELTAMVNNEAITLEIIQAIKKAYAEDEMQHHKLKRLAAQFGLKVPEIRYIVRGRLDKYRKPLGQDVSAET